MEAEYMAGNETYVDILSGVLGPAELAAGMVLAAETGILQERALLIGPNPQAAVEQAYGHVLLAASVTAVLVEQGAVSSSELSIADLRLRAEVRVAAGLAAILAGMTGNSEPPRWQEIMDQTLGIPAPGSEEEAAPAAVRLAARIRAAVAVTPKD